MSTAAFDLHDCNALTEVNLRWKYVGKGLFQIDLLGIFVLSGPGPCVHLYSQCLELVLLQVFIGFFTNSFVIYTPHEDYPYVFPSSN